MKMRNIFKITAFALLTMTCVHCSDKYEQPSPDYSKGMMESNFDNGSKVNIGESVSLIDLSMGVTNRVWTVDDDAYFTLGDASADRVDIAYNTSGTKYISLDVEFEDPELTFENTVYLTVLKNVKIDLTATHILLPDDGMTAIPELDADTGEVVDPSQVTIDYTPITISTGEFVDFIAITEGLPSTYVWKLEGSDIDEADYESSRIVRAGYYVAGTYDVELTAYREYPDSEDTLLLEDFIIVEPSDKSGVFRSVTVTEDEKMVVSFTQQLEALASGANGFTVKRNDVEVAIASAALNPSNSTQVYITVDGGIWSGDTVSLSYDGTALTTLAGNGVDPFEDKDCDPYIKNLIPNGDFSTEDLIFYSKGYPSYAVTSPQYCSLSNYDGEMALKLDLTGAFDGDDTIVWFESDSFYLTDGVTYMFEYSYISVAGDAGGEKYAKCFLMETATPWNAYSQNNFDLTQSTEWLEQATTFLYDAPSNATDGTYALQVKIENFEENEVVYLDNLKLYEYKKHTDIAGTSVDGPTISSQGEGQTL